MLKWLYATLSLVCMLAIATGESAPAAAAPTAPQIGACRWFCGASTTRFTSRSACEAVCPTACDEVC